MCVFLIICLIDRYFDDNVIIDVISCRLREVCLFFYSFDDVICLKVYVDYVCFIFFNVLNFVMVELFD